MPQRLLIFLLLNFGGLALGAFFMGEGPTGEWYQSMNKAPWTPPGWVFGTAWTTIMICFSIYMAYAWDVVKDQKALLILFGIEWVVNLSWNPAFFYFHQMLVGLVLIIALTGIVAYFFLGYWKTMKQRSFLMLPYLIWLLIATSLNFYAYWMN